MSAQPRVQCAKCPWKVGVNPHHIPNGYSVEAHRALVETISTPGLASIHEKRPAMACHETPKGSELPCVGWLVHQLGDGNNLALRIAVAAGKVDGNVRTVGRQHATFEDTLPTPRRNAHAR